MQIYPNTLIANGVTIHADAGDNATWIGENSFDNSARGRAQLEAECPTEIIQQVYAVWGDTTTVAEPTLLVAPVSIAPTLEDRVSAAEAAILALMG